MPRSSRPPPRAPQLLSPEPPKEATAEGFGGAVTSTRELYLPGGDAPAVGSALQNPDLARTYRLIARNGISSFYTGRLAREIAQTVQQPPKTDTTTLPVPPGFMTAADLAAYRVERRQPTHVSYRGYDVYGMAPSSSGGSTVGEALNIMERIDLGMTLPEAIAAPRATQRNTASVIAEQAFIDAYGAALAPFGHVLAVAGAPGTSAAEIGAATAIEFGPGGLLTAVAEPDRRGGGSALVVRPRR